jgi:RNA polymerase sigma-70 factor (ECF subfamily)
MLHGGVRRPPVATTPEDRCVATPTEAEANGRLATAGDLRLIADCLAGAPGAWDAFVAQFAGLFRHVAGRVAGQRGQHLPAADQDDIVAEILLACLRDEAAVLRGYAGRASLPTYLTVIARRVAVRWLTRRAAAGEPTAPRADVPAPPRGPSPADREQVEVLLGRLDERERLLVRLHHLEARSYGEISRLTGMPLGSIGPALSRAKAKMRLPAAG